MEIEIKTLIVDDEPLAQELVAQYVSQVPWLKLVDRCSSAREALDAVGKGGIDLLFLDIQMPGTSGLSLAQALGQMWESGSVSGQMPKIVFTTAYDNYAIDGYKLNAVDYLLKPFDFEEFQRAVGKVKRLIELERKAAQESAPRAEQKTETTEETDSFFFVKSEYKLVKIEYDKILYVEGLKDYVKIYLTDAPKPVLTLSTLKQMEARLVSHSFMRLHRSFIVNVKLITGVERGGVIVGGERIPVGDGYKGNFQTLLDRFTL